MQHSNKYRIEKIKNNRVEIFNMDTKKSMGSSWEVSDCVSYFNDANSSWKPIGIDIYQLNN